MRILIDTNIFIPMEDSAIDLDQNIAELNRLASGMHQLLIHPASRDDINRDKNTERRFSMLKRLEKYLELEEPPAFVDGEEEQHFGGQRKDNDRVDNLILLALYKNCAHWLVTQDEGIHKKARGLGINERVLTVEQAINSLLSARKEHSRLFPNIIDRPCYSLDVKNSIFDSLREGYESFDHWFNNSCAKTGRRAWVCNEGELIHALAIYKLEENPIITNDSRGLIGKVLKLCTFKVVKRGYKIGELLLKQAFNYAIDNELDYVYLTVDPGEHELLENLVQDFGFSCYGVDEKGRDIVYVKQFPSALPDTTDTPLDYNIKYYPAIKIDTTNKALIVPILPKYHAILFPEIQVQVDLFSDVSNSAGNSIKQAYLCKAPIKNIAPGDVVLFYRTEDLQSITTYGVVDKFLVESEAEKIFQWVSKRTVYTYNDIEGMAGEDVKVILFRLVRHLDTPVPFQRLSKLGVVNGRPQSIVSLSKENTKKLLAEAQVDDCFISN